MLLSCTQQQKIHTGSPDRPPIVIKAKYKNGREVKRKIINRKVHYIKSDIDASKYKLDTTSIYFNFFVKNL
jgi:anti-sigma28 factor (negative regulator of flagellin synthesis)